MITMYEIGPDGAWHGKSASILSTDGAPAGWTRTAPPALGPTERAVWSGTGWVVTSQASDPGLAQLKAERLALVRQLRHQAENAGVLVAGQRVRTDVTSQAKVAGAVQLFLTDPSLQHVDWEAQAGQWVSVDRDSMAAIGVAVGRHVQACFSRARELQQAIEQAPDLDTLNAIVLATGWPGAGALAPE